MDLSLVLCVLFAAVTGVYPLGDDIRIFQMHEHCGGKINLKWESIFTAIIELRPSVVTASTNPNDDDITPTDGVYSYQGNDLQNCEINVESWDFQNRMMVNLEVIELGNGSTCNGPHLEILDGLGEQSPRLRGLPSTICSSHTNDLQSQTFVTSDKHLTIRFHGDGLGNKDVDFRAVIVAYKTGPCSSYEHACENGRCIMSDLVCNGHNPCGDNSDCPSLIQPQEVDTAHGEDNVLLGAIIAISATLVFVIIVAVVMFRCYRIHQKHQRLSRQQQYIQARRQRPAEPIYERTVSQIESEIRLSPPSYTTLEGLSKDPEPGPSETTVEEIPDKCLQVDDNNPPSYACVMLHHQEYHLSEKNVAELT